MSQKVKIILNRSGVRELLRSDEAKEVCKSYADKAVSKLGSGYEVSTYTGKNRVNASVKAESVKAKQENAKTNSILKAVGCK